MHVRIPKRKLTVVTGVSGSGKTSLVLDTIAAESQRLINETYPGFMQAPPRPDVDRLKGLTAAIVVGQDPMAASARSIFGTATDITGHLRVLIPLGRTSRGRARSLFPQRWLHHVPRHEGGLVDLVRLRRVRAVSGRRAGPRLHRGIKAQPV